MNVKKAKLAFGASLIVLAVHADNSLAIDPAEAPTDGESTSILIGKKTSTPEPNRASFTINVGDLSIGEQIRLRFAKKTAIIFTGTGKEKDRICPFFNLASRKYDIIEVERNVFKITTDIDDDAMKKVQASGCMVTTRPDLNKIKYMNPEPPQN